MIVILNYILVAVAIILFGVSYFTNGRYTQRVGSSFLSSVILALGIGVFGGLSLLIVNGFSLHLTPFTVVMSFFFALSGLLTSMCIVFSLEKASLSLMSAFSMIGGMIVPSVVGMIFFNEQLTLNKAICYVLTLIGLAFTIKKDAGKKAFLSYIGVFLFNGTCAAMSTVFAKADFEKAASSDYSIMGAIFKAVIALALLPIAIRIAKKNRAEDEQAQTFSLAKYASVIVIVLIAAGGIVNTVANWLLPIAMTGTLTGGSGLDGSVVYPMITGGVMVVSTAFAYLNKNKPQKRELLAVAICAVALLVLVLPGLIQ